MLSNIQGKKVWSMKGPIVSIDVSKGKSDYQAFKDLNVKYTGSRSIKHNKEGFDEIVVDCQINWIWKPII